MAPRKNSAAAIAVFSALADETRRQILESLAVQGPATVTELAGRLPITRQGVAKHLAQLLDAGLVVPGEARGRRLSYRLNPAPVQKALEWLAALANRWDDRLRALERYLETG